uniref:Phosphodiesterase n=1 Tax=Trypanosoma congolense (strain IL3000) TaxID=1068625 RepID=F9W8G7_TRYCI|nr:unnamed protein product [Trypanosoma congolense IL3000]
MGCGIAKLLANSKEGISPAPASSCGNYQLSTFPSPDALKEPERCYIERPEVPRMLGKERYIISSGAVAMVDTSPAQAKPVGILLLYCTPTDNELTVSYLKYDTGAIYVCRFTDQELFDAKEDAGITHSWGAFFKSLASDLQKRRAVVAPISDDMQSVNFTITNVKESSLKFKFTCTLSLVSCTREKDHLSYKLEHVLEPLTRMTQIRRRKAQIVGQQMSIENLECEHTVNLAALQRAQAKIEKLLTELKPLREEAFTSAQATMEHSLQVISLKKQLRLLCAGPATMDVLDALYENGGAQYFEHVPQAVKHYPVEVDVDTVILACIRAAFPLLPGGKADSLISVMDRPELQPLLDNSSRQVVREVLEILSGVDRWNFDAIRLEVITNGNALFYTTYLILYKLDLVAHFRLDDAVLQRFLLGVQSAYHPNPYHNSMHAADVTQVNYYIITIAGLREKCRLQPEDLLGAVLAGAVHDFDHPGLNNNFHTRAGAYLSVFYNDISILENHHIASTFQLLKHPSYNLLAPLSADQFRIVREVMVEMVLATDMLNHGSILKKFQSRLVGAGDWYRERRDVLLALSMSIKTADLSNCIRPYHIYSEWSGYIAREFYNQGDEEEKNNLTISPFMNRKTSDKDLPEGQKSFITYVVVPMMEAVVVFLPHLRFTLQFCENNRRAWDSVKTE